MTASENATIARTSGHAAEQDTRGTLAWPTVALPLAVSDILLVTGLGSAIGELYYGLASYTPQPLAVHASLGAAFGLLYVVTAAMIGLYRKRAVLRMPSRPTWIAGAFLLSMLMLIAVLFLTKSSEDFSRSVTALTFVVGLPLLMLKRSAEMALVRSLARSGRLEALRVMPIGTSERIKHFVAEHGSGNPGLRLVGRAPLNLMANDPGFRLELSRVLETARAARPDCVLICRPWTDPETLKACVEGLAELPAAIHIESDPYIRALSADPEGSLGNPLGIQVVRRPFSDAELRLKRGFDIVGAGLAILLASPVLIAIALAIRLDGPGPILFRQRRYGFNREPFEILKFRTMRHDPEGKFRQATSGDNRITRVGRILRSTNLDELPQFFNVLRGDMSLIGPRPHPVELDEQFQPLISHYARRLRARPGITGWAQANGLRGETDTTEKMERRVMYDLYYLNNWSFWLDLRIVFMTLLSAAAYRNAV